MKRATFTIATLLACSLWLVAQQSPTSAAGQAASQAGQAAAGQAGQTAKDAGQSVMNATKLKVRGCLSGSDGNFTLTDNKGTAYQLTGNTADLSAHVGHEIQVTGTTAEAAASAVGATSKSVEVTNVKEIASKCSSSSGSKPPQ